MGKIKDIYNQRFGRLIVLKYIGINKHHKASWLCKCDCGNQTIVSSGDLISGKQKSCGCYRQETNIANSTTHGLTNHRLYHTYHNMIARCYNPKSQYYCYYGGRDIKVCDEWKNDFQIFYNWAISNGYKDTLTIDRIDNNGNYEPDNCRWVTQHQQNRNQRSNRLLTYNNETLCITDMAIKYNIPLRTLIARLKRGWDIKRALTEPIHKTK